MFHLTDEQWAEIEPVVTAWRATRPRSRGGRPPAADRDVLDGVLWLQSSGAAWRELPNHYPPRSTCHRRYVDWLGAGVLDRIIVILAEHLERQGDVSLDELHQVEIPDDPDAQRTWRWRTVRLLRCPYAAAVVRRVRTEREGGSFGMSEK